MQGVLGIAEAVESDFARRLPGMNRARRRRVAQVVAAMLASFAGEVAKRLSACGQTLVVMMHQSHINDLNEVLMVSLRFGGRALPVAWRVKTTQGGIGFAGQEEVLAAGWDYRIRLKANLTLTHEGGEMTTGEVFALALDGLAGARLCGGSAAANIFALHEEGHAASA
jgi:hypothetical protein